MFTEALWILLKIICIDVLKILKIGLDIISKLLWSLKVLLDSKLGIQQQKHKPKYFK